eukprot:maker-scaffold21_size687808-snap-gene-4.9 protein:Tk09839 transcript:maker-scaffold21_size687808-snap-gene-4.9-mRNA-1 annotation:"hypothetical protein DAPPUDRAFT_220083"
MLKDAVLEDLLCHEPKGTVVPPHIHPTVFLTVNAYARVTWTGSIQARNVILNWVRPEQSQPSDWVGLFDVDISNEHILHEDEAKLVVRMNETQASYKKTDMPLRFRIFHEIDACMDFWIAYVRVDEVISINCLKTRPRWMTKMREYIGFLPISQLMLPGTHNSVLQEQFEGFFASVITKRWYYNQEEPIWNQLVMGIRFLDIDISTTMDGVASILELYDTHQGQKVKDEFLQGPLGDLFKALEKFTQISQDLIVIKFVFRRLAAKRRHRHVKELIETHFGPKMVAYDPMKAGGLTLDECLDQDKSLIFALEELSSWSGEQISSPPSSKRSTSLPVTWNQTVSDVRELSEFLEDFYHGQRPRRFHDKYWRSATIVSSDFFLSNDLIDVAIDCNLKRAICSKNGEGASCTCRSPPFTEYPAKKYPTTIELSFRPTYCKHKGFRGIILLSSRTADFCADHFTIHSRCYECNGYKRVRDQRRDASVNSNVDICHGYRGTHEKIHRQKVPIMKGGARKLLTWLVFSSSIFSTIYGSPLTIFGTTVPPGFKRSEGKPLYLGDGCFVKDLGYTGTEVRSIEAVDRPLDCQYECTQEASCAFFSYNTRIHVDEAELRKCTMYEDDVTEMPEAWGTISGPRECST